jgi:ribosomal-protein-alanine N-acetyltransferase
VNLGRVVRALGALGRRGTRAPEPPAERLPRADVRVEVARAEDLPEILTIEAASFTEPWTPEMFREEFRRPDVATIFVARAADGPGPAGSAAGRGRVVGFLCLSLPADEGHINNMAVDPRWRRRGVARALMDRALEYAAGRRARTAHLEVRTSNVGAQALYRDFGFEVVGVRRRYYSRPPEDALVMQKSLRGLR